MKKNNKLLIIVGIIAIIAIIGAILAYLYIATDVFRSNQELFAKYLYQEIENIEKMIDIEAIDTYQNLSNENKYISATNIKASHSEGGEISNPINNLSAKLEIQKDAEQQYFYGTAEVLLGEEKFLVTEIIKDQEQYGIRFPNVKQFVTMKKDENLETIANDIGIEVKQLQKILNAVDGTEKLISKEEIESSKNDYLNIIKTEILKGVFEKQRNAMITYNNETIKTNAYSVSLTSEQVKNILTQILDNISEDEEIPTVKITVYEQNQTTVRTVLEMGIDKITIENIQQNGQIKSKIKYLNMSAEEASEYDVEITKTNLENQENFEIFGEVLQGEEEYTISFTSKMQIVDNNIQLNMEISSKEDITTTSLVLDSKVEVKSNFEKAQTLETGEYISLSAIQDQTKRSTFINALKGIVTQNVSQDIMSLILKLTVVGEDDAVIDVENPEEGVQGEEISQVEINKFNAKFEFYTGDNVSIEKVKTLLDIVKNNLETYEITKIEAPEDATSIIPENDKISIKLNIKKDVVNEAGVTETLGQLNESAKYKVSISYKDGNGLIDYITISEI